VTRNNTGKIVRTSFFAKTVLRSGFIISALFATDKKSLATCLKGCAHDMVNPQAVTTQGELDYLKAYPPSSIATVIKIKVTRGYAIMRRTMKSISMPVGTHSWKATT
jgi:hypothetical protein